ncbi:MAG: glutamate--tRNA ligase [Actinobacteria bacterium]|nr:glutamate--tRNA ligase [Actinomycetota bacterium]
MEFTMNANNKNTEPRFRFAPSPTGGLHIGTARTALFNWLAARSMKGKFLLRIEDTDIHRSKKTFEKSITADLDWLGIEWDEFYRQSDRISIYREHAEELLRRDKAYLCFCTQERLDELKKEQYRKGEMSKYDNRCRELSEKEVQKELKDHTPYAIRFRVPVCEVVFEDFIRGKIKFDSGVFGDFVIMKSDGTPSYNFAVVVDDAEMRITHVLRGEDHITNTARQIMVFKSFGFKLPDFGHLSMILGSDGAKLSKRFGSRTVGEFKDDGYLSEAVGNYLALLSWSPGEGREIFKSRDIISNFKINDISRSPAIFDIEKLNWVNANHIRQKGSEELLELAEPFLSEELKIHYESSMNSGIGYNKDKIKFLRCADTFREKIKVLSELDGYIRDYFKESPASYSPEAVEILKSGTSETVLLRLLEKIENTRLEFRCQDEKNYEAMGPDYFRDFISGFAEDMKKSDIKGSRLYLPIRSALTGQIHGPELPRVMAILGIENCILRIELCISHFYKIDKITKR